MATNGPTTQNGSVEQLSKRDTRALTQYLTVLNEAPGVSGSEGLYLVVSQSGGSYVVDPGLGTCECEDAEYRDPDGGCKHIRRVRFATGERTIPGWVDQEAVDPDLGEHVDGEVRFAGVATDGGGPNALCKSVGCTRPATHTVVVNAPARGYGEDPACADHADKRRGKTYVRDVREGYDG